MVDTRSVDENENENENDDENDDENDNDNADAKGASVAFGPYGRRTLFATTGGLSPQPLGRWP